jgi:16S rRNA G966 N2-methylase RsmD
MLERNRAMLGAQQVQIVAGDALACLAGMSERFDVVFLDPPFRQNALAPALEQLPQRMNPGGRVYVEAPGPLEIEAPWSAHWREVRRARAGQVSYQLLEKR